jgi:hypothetical protein
MAQLERASQLGLRQLSELKANLQGLTADLADLQHRVPLLVRSIWGKQSEAVLDALRERRITAHRLIARWEEAEHRLVAVANSLATLQNGQVGVACHAPSLHYYLALNRCLVVCQQCTVAQLLEQTASLMLV